MLSAQDAWGCGIGAPLVLKIGRQAAALSMLGAGGGLPQEARSCACRRVFVALRCGVVCARERWPGAGLAGELSSRLPALTRPNSRGPFQVI